MGWELRNTNTQHLTPYHTAGGMGIKEYKHPTPNSLPQGWVGIKGYKHPTPNSLPHGWWGGNKGYKHLTPYHTGRAVEKGRSGSQKGNRAARCSSLGSLCSRGTESRGSRVSSPGTPGRRSPCR